LPQQLHNIIREGIVIIYQKNIQFGYFWHKLNALQEAHEIKPLIDSFAQTGKPFFLILNFKATQGYFFSVEELVKENIQIQFPTFSNTKEAIAKEIIVEKKPISFEAFKTSFDTVAKQLHYGNSFLTNLTCATPITSEEDVSSLFYAANAKYKLNFKNQWICFSPETFVQIKEQQLFSFPMKGTIDASLPEAKKILLNDAKEMAEHYTIVDLIRNDMSMVAKNVRVEKFRYVETIYTATKNLLQVSSRICGDLEKDYLNRLSEIIFTMLPAGSISGAPKKKTIDIIEEAEMHERGFYTGTAFYFDGKELDSCVLIRFIENTPEGMLYKSGGGITIHSVAEKEYQEMMDKIYIPTHASN
jgi:para-aminobenzoate synthetase component I